MDAISAISDIAGKLFINGAWVAPRSGKLFPTINPYDHSRLADLAEASAEDVDLAVQAASAAFEGGWSTSRPDQRNALLLRLAVAVERDFEILATLDTLEMGTPISASQSGKGQCVGMLRYYAGQALTIAGETLANSSAEEIFTYTRKEPIGVVASITPWNFPISAAIMKMAPALAAGCTVVLKPSEFSSLSTLYLAKLAQEVGLPAGVFNVVTGHGHGAGQALADHRGIAKLAFTGSVATGQRILASSVGNLKKVSLELGGKSANIVLADADLDRAAMWAALACFANSGQICVAGTRLLVERSICDVFVAKVQAFARTMVLGDPMDPATMIGPIANDRQFGRIQDYLQVGQAEGAKLLDAGAEGATPPGPTFMAPKIFTGVTNDMRIAQEEIFGPVLSVIAFDSIEEAISIANDSDFGLGAGLWTKDVGQVHRIAARLKVGTVWVNTYLGFDPGVPFGGVKMSGHAREMGPDHIKDYLVTKAVWVHL